MPGLHGVLETALYVTDLERSTRSYRDVLFHRISRSLAPSGGLMPEPSVRSVHSRPPVSEPIRESPFGDSLQKISRGPVFQTPPPPDSLERGQPCQAKPLKLFWSAPWAGTAGRWPSCSSSIATGWSGWCGLTTQSTARGGGYSSLGRGMIAGKFVSSAFSEWSTLDDQVMSRRCTSTARELLTAGSG